MRTEASKKKPLFSCAFICATVEDAALMLNVMAGFDNKDSTSTELAVPDYTATLKDSLQGLKIGLPKQYFSADLDPAIASLVEAAAQQLASLGASLQAVSLPSSDLAVSAYYVVAPAEGSVPLGYSRWKNFTQTIGRAKVRLKYLSVARTLEFQHMADKPYVDSKSGS